MKSPAFQGIRGALIALLFAAALPAFAQKVTIENQGQASENVTQRALTAEAVESDIGKPQAGRAQVVFFRSAKSPGTPVAIREASGSLSIIDLDPGMYFVAAVMPGTHAYATADTGPFTMDLDAGRTYYVQAIRNKNGNTQLIRSSADKFARAAH
jgi:uncharacterized protein (DUF2141 family)